MKTIKEFKPVKVALTSKQVDLTEVEAKTSRRVVALYEKQIREEMLGTPAQAAREYSQVTNSIYLSIRKRIGKDFNIAYKAKEMKMWVWKGVGLNGE